MAVKFNEQVELEFDGLGCRSAVSDEIERSKTTKSTVLKPKSLMLDHSLSTDSNSAVFSFEDLYNPIDRYQM